MRGRTTVWALLVLVTMAPMTLGAVDTIEESVLISDCHCLSSLEDQIRMGIDTCSASDCISSLLEEMGVHMAPISLYEYNEIYPNKGEDPADYEHCITRRLSGEEIFEEVFDHALQEVDIRCGEWFDHVWDGIEIILEETHAVMQDNVSSPAFVNGGISQTALDAFPAWVESSYSADERARLGIPDLDQLDIVQYLIDNELTDGNRNAPCDPVFRALVMYENETNLAHWEALQDRAASYGQRHGQEVRLFGNQAMMWVVNSSLPYATLLSQFNPIVEIEHVLYTDPLPPAIRWSLVPKIGRASATKGQPVWVRGIIYDWELEEPYFSRDLYRLVMSETYAHGARRIVELIVSSPHGDIQLPTDIREGLVEFGRWIKRYGLYETIGESLADVALVYSVPSLMWRVYPPTDHWNWEQTYELSGWAHILEEEHIPFDVVLFGHPNLWEDGDLGRTLDQYGTVILPMVDCLSDEQLRALQNYAARGGKLIVSGDFAARNEDFELRSSAPTFPEGTLAASPTLAAQQLYAGRLQGSDAPLARDQLVRMLDEALDGARQIDINAGRNVSVSLFQDARDDIQLHIVNYDYQEDSRTITPTQRLNVSVSLTEAQRATVYSVWLFTPDAADAIELPFEIDGEQLRVDVPPVHIYSVLVIGSFDLTNWTRGQTACVLDSLPSDYLQETAAVRAQLDSHLASGRWRDALISCEDIRASFWLDKLGDIGQVRIPLGSTPHCVELVGDTLYVFERDAYALLVIDLESGDVTEVSKSMASVADMASTGSELILFTENGEGWAYDLVTSTVRPYTLPGSVDGEVLGVAYESGTLYLLIYGGFGPAILESSEEATRLIPIRGTGFGELVSLQVWQGDLVTMDYSGHLAYQLEKTGSLYSASRWLDLDDLLGAEVIADGGLRGLFLTESATYLTSISYRLLPGGLHVLEGVTH